MEQSCFFIFSFFFIFTSYTCPLTKTINDLVTIQTSWEARNLLFAGKENTAEFSLLIGTFDDDGCRGESCKDNPCRKKIEKIPGFICPHYKLGTSMIDSLILPLSSIPKRWQTNLKPGKECASLIFISKGSTIAQVDRFDNLNMKGFGQWLAPKASAEWQFKNYVGEPINLFWFKRKEHPIGGMEKNGPIRNENTFIGHWFVARTLDGNLIDWLAIDNVIGEWIIEPPQCESEEQCKQEFLQERFYQESLVDAKANRASLNYVQPKIIDTFTKIGFKKFKMPKEIYKPIYDFWVQNRHANSVSEENSGEVFNQREVAMHMLHLGEKERRLLEKEMKPLLENWSSTTNLVMTSLYGIRWYSRDAILDYHVDTISTHVISAIINVNQEEMEEDWELAIYGHDGKVYKIPMEPGDMVFYESASCLHSREGPLKGKTYANVFIHYAPEKSVWNYDWF